MIIGIDLDDTTFITVNSMIKYADKYNSEYLHREGANGDLGLIQNRFYLKAIYGWTDEEKFNFFDMYYKNVLEECTLMKDANKVCKKLMEEDGDSIYFITARLTNVKNCNTEEITKRTLNGNNVPYNKLIINASDKIKVSQEEHIDLFIEDSYETCKQLSEIGIRSILMTTKMNEKIDAGNIPRVTNWNEVYNEIQKIRKNLMILRSE